MSCETHCFPERCGPSARGNTSPHDPDPIGTVPPRIATLRFPRAVNGALRFSGRAWLGSLTVNKPSAKCPGRNVHTVCGRDPFTGKKAPSKLAGSACSPHGRTRSRFVPSSAKPLRGPAGGAGLKCVCGSCSTARNEPFSPRSHGDAEAIKRKRGVGGRTEPMTTGATSSRVSPAPPRLPWLPDRWANSSRRCCGSGPDSAGVAEGSPGPPSPAAGAPGRRAGARPSRPESRTC